MWCSACIRRSLVTLGMTVEFRHPERSEGSPECGAVPALGDPSLHSG
ncbi:Uncharacterised protein [Legionella quateirensis]|uniref:Uncharacterized protein n=1 Tax=Legionella quateirensis TaxID=45072 RepID=A0A378KV34_9GAMM|nr:Uncharacterised protein [Legionella quateirensis]